MTKHYVAYLGSSITYGVVSVVHCLQGALLDGGGGFVMAMVYLAMAASEGPLWVPLPRLSALVRAIVVMVVVGQLWTSLPRWRWWR